jgi:hypothetical protein
MSEVEGSPLPAALRAGPKGVLPGLRFLIRTPRALMAASLTDQRARNGDHYAHNTEHHSEIPEQPLAR